MSSLDHTASLDASRAEAPSNYVVLSVVACVLAAVSLLWSFVDLRMVDGAPVWMKPLKFSLSFVMLFGTIALVETRISLMLRDGWAWRIIGWIMAAAFVTEMAYMMYQAGRGEASHFNLSTPFHATMYSVVMGGGAFALVSCTGLIGWLVKRDTEARVSPALREAIWLGFGLSFVLTLGVASYMSNGTSHFVGLHPEGAPVLPLLGWSGVTGDLRPAHFLSLHAMQALPLLALLLIRLERARDVGVIRSAALLYTLVTLAVFGQALLKMPLVPLG